MSEGINRATLLGFLGADPELRHTQGGQGVLNMRLATTESYLDRDKVRNERTEWHSVVLFGPRAEALARFLKKGSQLLVEGRLQTSSYDKDGAKRYKTEIVAINVVLCGGNGDRQTGGSERPTHAPRGGSPSGTKVTPSDYGGDMDDVPFISSDISHDLRRAGL